MEEQEQNSRTRRNMNWNDGSVLVDGGTQFWRAWFLFYLQAGTSFRGNFEFPLFEYGKLDQLLFWSKICYKIVRRLLYYRAVYFL